MFKELANKFEMLEGEIARAAEERSTMLHDASRKRGKIFSPEEEVGVVRLREEAILVRIDTSERRLEGARRWKRSYRRRELHAEAASRIWEERVVVA